MSITTTSDSPSAFRTNHPVLLNLYRAMSGAYGISVTGLIILRLVFGESWKLVALFNSYLHLMLIPALVLLPVSLLLRRPRLALTQAAPFLMFMLTYGSVFLPRPPVTQAGTPISIFSYNLSKDNQSPDTVIDIIRAADADIVALQELNLVMAEALVDLYPYHAFHPDESYPGQGVLSRYPILEDDYWRMYLGHQRVLLDMNQQPIALYNTHPVHPFIRERGFFDPVPRAEEVTEILTRAAGETVPTLIAGDFNMTDLTGDYARIAALYGDTYREIGWGMGFTFPDLGQRLLVARLDYIFHSPHFTALESHVWGTSGGSDHRPIWARLALAAN